jgi:hypothetical protein
MLTEQPDKRTARRGRVSRRSKQNERQDRYGGRGLLRSGMPV